jgi:uncharacterized YccA/Bax inhibitor family protein
VTGCRPPNSRRLAKSGVQVLFNPSVFTFMPSNNPVLRRGPFSTVQPGEVAEPMTLNGVIGRTFFFLLLVVASSAVTWMFLLDRPQALSATILIGALGGLGCALFTTFNPRSAAISGSIYCLFEGLAIGGITLYAEVKYPGVAFQAVCLTFAVLFALLGLYSFRIIRVSQTFQSVIVSATIGIALVYGLNLLLGMFHAPLGFISGSGPIGILFSLFVVGIAALNLILDFQFIETGIANRAPKWAEWYAGFSLMVTLIWLYLEILRLLMKLARRR